jgi:hypothetical protein
MSQFYPGHDKRIRRYRAAGTLMVVRFLVTGANVTQVTVRCLTEVRYSERINGAVLTTPAVQEGISQVA